MNHATPQRMRNVFLLVILFFYDLTCFGTPVEGNAKVVAAGSRPNIIFILTDDQRWDALGYAGNKLIHTPEMDKLAKSGAYFKNALVTTPICAGSRASILSGLYERTHGYNFQTGPVREEYMQQAYPKLLKEAGYYTGFFGKFGVRYAPKEELFDVYEDYDRNGAYKDRRGYYYKTLGEDTVHLTRYTGQKALDFIDQADLEKPFCLSLSFSAPHAHDPAEDQYFWQSATDQLYAGTEMPGPELGEDRFFNILPESVRNGFNRTRWYWRYDTPEKYQHSVKGYYRMIAGIDLEIANIRQRLKEKGLDKNTVIILMGDNGYFMGERQLAGKWLLYDNSIRVPLIIFDPRVKKHQDIEQMVLNIDVPATLLDMAGVDVPQSYHGKSLQPIVSGVTSNLQRDTVLIEHLWEFENIPPSEGVRTKDWKYFRYVNDKSIEELYNLRDDPKEINNLANDPAHQNVRAGLAAATDNLIQQYKDPLSAPPYGLMTDFIRKPGATTVNNSSPNYSWIVPQEAVMQQAYQVLVASSPQQLDKNIGDVWNSGQVRSSQSASIEQEKPLQPLTDYYWKVRIWDQDNRVSAYSDMQSFKTTGFQSGFTSGNIFRLENIKPVSVREIAEDSYFVDFGKDAFGTLAFTYEAPAPDTLTVRLGEKLEGNRIDQDPGGTIRYQEMKIAVSPAKKNYRVGLPPNERNTLPVAVALPDTFGVLMPFRYVELDGVKAELTSDDLTQKAYFYYWDEDESSFTSSDTTLNQIWDICKYSMKATSFSGIYVDGDRERIPYEADAYINQLGHYNTDREYSMGKQTIEWFMHHPTWPTEWLLHTALMMYQDYYYTGSTELIEKYYEPLKHKTLIHLAREDGLISSSSERVTDAYMAQLGFSDPSNRLRDIVDWPPAQKDTGWKLATEEGERDGHEMLPVNTVVNSFFYQNMKIMEELAHVLGRHEDEAQFSLMVAKTKKAINEKLFDKEKGIYIDGEGATHSSLHANMMPLAFGIVPESYQQSVVDFIKSRGMACSVYGAQFLLEGLYRVGESEYVLGLMTATHDRSWWNMIEMGSTITLEAWDMKYKPNADWNHAWGAAPANIIPRYLWGITPKTPGFGIISIQPQMGNLEHSTIKVPTLKGSVKGEYEYVNDRLKKYTIEIPANTVAEFSMQSAPNEVVHLNGQKVNPLFGSVRLEPGIHHIEIRVNSF